MKPTNKPPPQRMKLELRVTTAPAKWELKCSSCGVVGPVIRHWKGTCEGSISIYARFCRACAEDAELDGWSPTRDIGLKVVR